MRIRIPNVTTWSDALPLEYGEGESTGHHCIVQVIMGIYFDLFMFMSFKSIMEMTSGTESERSCQSDHDCFLSLTQSPLGKLNHDASIN